MAMHCLPLLALLLPAALPAPVFGQIATDLVAARGFAAPTAVTGTADGEFVFSAEGAAIAVIEPGHGVPGVDPDLNFDQPLKRFQLGRFQPHVVRMIVDPEADFGDCSSLAQDGPCYRNYLFLATGPNGLWIADGDASTGVVNRIARVDDSESGDPLEQDSHRHCNDVELVTVDGHTYLLATFAARDDSRLRVYCLDDVRAVLGCAGPSAPETGRELEARCEYVLGAYGAGDPSLEYTRDPAQIDASYASDLLVDQGDPCDDEAFAYVAMRTDGLVRVRLREDALKHGTACASDVEWGPRFGDGSHYATVAPPAPFPDERELYTNFRWINQQYDPDVVERSDPPYFSILALHRNDRDGQQRRHGHKLYVGVDNLGFVVFDVSNPHGWGPTMPIDHHEGEAIELQGGAGLLNRGAWPERVVAHAPSSGATAVNQLLGYVRGMGFADCNKGLKLVATYSGEPSIGLSPVYLEGFAYDDQFQFGGVTYWEQMRGPRLGFTRVFGVKEFPDESPAVTLTENIRLEAGGDTLFVPSDQSNQLHGPAGPQRIEFVHNLLSSVDPEEPGTQVTRPTICMLSARMHPNQPLDTLVAIRDVVYLAGRRCYGLQQSLVDPDLIMTSDNDGHPREGLPYLLGGPGARSIDVDYVATALNGNDQRLTTGVVMGRQSQWLDPRLGPNQQAQLGAGAATHRVAIQTIPSSFLGSPPVSELRINMLQTPDRWGLTGRAFYLGGMVDPRYDAWVQANVPGLGAAEYMFVFRQSNVDGIAWGRRDKLMDLITGGTFNNEQFLTQPQMNAAGVEWRTLNTHPEFDGFPFHPSQPGYAAARAWYSQPVAPAPYGQRVKTWEPEMVRVRPRVGSGFDAGWVLAVPSGVGVFEEEEYPDLAAVSITPNVYRKLDDIAVPDGAGGTATGDSDWLPNAGSEEAGSFEQGRVLFWDFTDPSNLPVVPGKPAGSSNLGRVSLPVAAEESPENDVGRSSFAWHLECLEAERTAGLHSYALVGDFVGGVHAYEVSDILNGVAPILHASWYPPLGRQDRLTNNIRDVVLDREGEVVHAYVAVQRVGIVVLRVDVTSSGVLSLTEVALIDDIAEPVTLHLRVVEGTGERLLYACDNRQGLRVYSSL
jgi:hypothetical protein